MSGPALRADVLEVVADVFHLTVDELLEPSKVRPRLDARRVAYQLLHDQCWMSWGSVALDMGLQEVGNSVADSAAKADPGVVTVCLALLKRKAAADA